MLAVFVREFSGMTVAIGIGATGAVLLTATLWLSNGDRPATGVGAGLLALPAGAGLVGGALVAVVLLVEDIFPVEEEALLSVGWLLTLGHTGVVVGCSVAVLGLGIATRDVVGEHTLSRSLWTGIGVATVPVMTGAGFLLLALGTESTPDTTVVPPVAALVNLLATPVLMVVGNLPVPVAALVLGAVAVLVVSAVGRLLGRLPSTRFGDPASYRGGAIAAGTVATIVILSGAEWIYDRALTEILDRFPVAVEGDIIELSNTVTTSFGESTVVLLAAVLCIGVTIMTVFLLRVAVVLGAVSSGNSGSALAGTGVFLATMFAGTLGASRLLVIGGVLASVLVWGLGWFGGTLTREVGTVTARRVELAHLGGALLVGVVAGALALLVISWLPAEPAAPTTTDLLALCSVVVGLLSLVVALR